MEIISIAFLMSVLTSYWFLSAVLVAAVITEYNDKYKTTAALTIVAVASATIMFSLPYWLLFAYLPVGIVWSFWRWRIFCKNCSALAKDGKLTLQQEGNWKTVKEPTKEQSRAALVKSTLLLPNLDKIISWIICFPVSMIENLVDDFIHVLKIAVTEWFAKVYRMSTESALKDFDEEGKTSEVGESK